VDFPLERGTIEAAMSDWTSYTRTEYVVLENGGMAVVRLHKARGRDLFRKVESSEIISLPEDTVFVDDPGADVLNAPAMAALQAANPGKTVVVRGMFSHVNFISGLVPLRLRVLDDVPPEPMKLGVLVSKALESGYVDIPVIPELEEISMGALIRDVTTSGVMFPCRVSGLEADMPFCFLDDAPELPEDTTLIGCNLSLRIFESLYGRRPDAFINVCPLDLAEGSEVPTIVKCCKVKEGHRIDGNVVSVPWGATVPEVADAINALFSD
jgi:hypothetical protein